jgi:hypothetical protein
MKTILEVPASLASLIGTAIRDGRERRRIPVRLAVAEASAVGAREYERGRDREDVLLGVVGVGVYVAVVILLASVSVEHWEGAVQSVGLLFVLIPFCAMASPLAFTDFDARFSIEDGRGPEG